MTSSTPPVQQQESTSTSKESSVFNQPLPSTTTSVSQEQQPRSITNETDDDEDRIQSSRDVWEAIKLAWHKQKGHIFTSWVHVPLGIMFLLTITWGFRLAINEAPFRFPAPVIAMILFFAILLLLDWLSGVFPGKRDCDVEKEAVPSQRQAAQKKRFVDPFMKLLAPPCEFCLRNMSVMFTPSFVLIPAREVIPGREIGLIAAWFTISQVAAFVFPVLYIWMLDWIGGGVKKYSKQMKRKGSMTPSQFDTSRRASMATISGVDWEKGVSFAGGYKLGAVATGLSGLTANVIAPISHLPMDIDADGWRQIESTAIEQARQQGDPAVTGVVDRNHPAFAYRNYSPKSDVSNFQHHHQHRPGMVGGRSSSRRSARSRSRSPGATMKAREPQRRNESSSPSPNPEYRFPFTTIADDARLTVPLPTLQPDLLEKATTFHQLTTSERKKQEHGIEAIEKADENITMSRRNSEFNPDLETRRPSRVSFDHSTKEAVAMSVAAKYSKGMGDIPEKQTADGKPRVVTEEIDEIEREEEEQAPSTRRGSEDDDCGDAIERLSCWISDLITPTIYFIFFLVGIPLFFVADIALPLFLGVNILTFIAAITIVPPKVRRFLHPILSCSIATVLIIWAFAAMKGISLKDCLNRFYSIDIRYLQLWAPEGYEGKVPGAGDVLFSTLDAGIVALAVPMYRFRKELKENFARMMMVLVPCASLSLFFWNWIAALMGMDEIRSLAFTARFMSTPLAIELAANIGADESITVILVVITGIVAAILKDQFFKLMRVDREDYIVIGITMGSTAGAIGASSLISTPRVMAVASLSFVIFGSILLIATAIPPIVDIVRMLA